MHINNKTKRLSMNKTVKLSYVQNADDAKDAFIAVFNDVKPRVIAKIKNAAWKNAKMKDIACGSHVLFTTDMGISWSGWDEDIETTETFANAIIEECKKQGIEVL